jgi:exonuclease III
MILVRKVIICGDVNIVHQERDIKNWKANQKIGIPTNQRKRNMKNCPITVMFSSKTDSTNTWTSEIKHYSSFEVLGDFTD